MPIPPPLGSPQGPNQWFLGDPVVFALIPWYVVPLTVFPSIYSVKFRSLDTIPAVKLLGILSKISMTNFKSYSLYSTII